MRYAAALCLLLLSTASSGAQPSGGGAPVIVQPKNGDTVSSPVTIVISGGAGSEMANMPAMSDPHHGAHLHLFIDAPPPTPGKMVPMDAHHIHLLHGETQKTVRLPAGTHTIQLFEGSVSHVIDAGARHSDPVTFQVR